MNKEEHKTILGNWKKRKELKYNFIGRIKGRVFLSLYLYKSDRRM